MNLLHLKYAVEVAKTRSISQAAENLYMNQPNLSRAIKELEETVGISIFNRTSRGITVTPEGDEFLQYAHRILAQVKEMEDIYVSGKKKKQALSVCVPRASYISYALAEFAHSLSLDTPAEVFYKETNTMRAVAHLIKEEYNLAIIRYQTAFDRQFKSMFAEKKLVSETITEFQYVLLMSKEHPLAQREDIRLEELSGYIEISHADPYVPSVSALDVKKAELSEHVDKRIYVFERASQFVLLGSEPSTFMWVSPIPEPLLEKFGLIQKRCSANAKVYKDVLLYRKGYRLTELDTRFITMVCEARRKYL